MERDGYERRLPFAMVYIVSLCDLKLSTVYFILFLFLSVSLFEVPPCLFPIVRRSVFHWCTLFIPLMPPMWFIDLFEYEFFLVLLNGWLVYSGSHNSRCQGVNLLCWMIMLRWGLEMMCVTYKEKATEGQRNKMYRLWSFSTTEKILKPKLSAEQNGWFKLLRMIQ